MTDLTAQLTDRLAHIDWDPAETDPRLRVRLMREFLRRSAVWAHHLDSGPWPFFDVADRVDPSVRAAPDQVETVLLACATQQPAVQQTCEWALHFAALRQSGRPLPSLPDPFEPLVVLYENGGGFTLDGTGMIDVDIDASVGRGTYEEWLQAAPISVPGGLLDSEHPAKQ